MNDETYRTYCDHCQRGQPILACCQGCVGCGKHIHYAGFCSRECADADVINEPIPERRRNDN